MNRDFAKLPGKCLLVLVVVVGQACARNEPEVPEPIDLSAFAPSVRQALEEGRSQFEAALESGADDEAIGHAFGNLGMLYLAHQLDYAAESMFVQAAALDPAAFAWPYLMAVLLQERGDFKLAVDWYDRALAIDGDYTAANIRRADTLFESGLVDDAELAYSDIVKKTPDNALALAGLGQIAMWRKDYGQAVSYYSKAVEASPGSDQLHYPLSQALAGSGRRDEAKRQLSLAGTNRPVVGDPVLLEVESLSRSVQLHIERGLALMAAGSTKMGIASLREAVALDPQDQYALGTLGQALLAAGQRGEARAVLERSVSMGSTVPVTFLNLGTLYEMHGQQSEADDLYARAMELDPNYPEPRLLMANSLMRNRRFDDALTHYQMLIVLDPGKALYQYRAAMLAQVTGDCSAALAAIQRASQLAPSDGDVMQARARIWSVCRESGDAQRQEALDIAILLVDARPGIDTLQTLALAHAALGHFDQAIAAQDRAIALARSRGDRDRAQAMDTTRAEYVAGRVPQKAYNQFDPSLNPSALN